MPVHTPTCSTMVSIGGLFYCLNEIVFGHSTMDFLGGVGFQVLRDIRGIDDVEEEFGDIRAACTKAASITNPWRTICRRAYAPQLFIAITATLFQQWTGVSWFLTPEFTSQARWCMHCAGIPF